MLIAGIVLLHSIETAALEIITVIKFSRINDQSYTKYLENNYFSILSLKNKISSFLKHLLL